MSNHSWFCDTPGGSGRLRLFCFPFAGGNAALFRPWQAILGPEIALSAVQLPGRGARVFEPTYVDLDLLVAALREQIRPWLDRPFAFFGHSLGALVAFELARALRRAGLPMPCALWVSGAEGPQTREIRHRLHDLKPADFTAALRDYGGTPQEVLDEEELMALLSPGLRADFALSERYVYRPQPPLDVPLHLLRGEDDPYVDARRAAGWSLESRLPLRERVFPGGHFFIEPHQQAVAALLRDELLRDELPGAPEDAAASPQPQTTEKDPA